MYVFVDMEWISNQHGNHWPTQLAAARVDAQWNTVDTFSVLFRPRDFSLQQWGHMAFSGWSREQFLDGESLYAGLDAFRLWLQPEDTICWWHQEASDLFNMFSKVSGVPDMTQHVVLLCDYIYGYLAGQEASVGSPYKICAARNIVTPSPAHCSVNDVATMQLLAQDIGFEQKYLLEPPKRWGKDAMAQKGSSAYKLLYDPQAKLLHQSDCELLPDDRYLPAFLTFKLPIRRKYKPCSCCRDEFLDALWDRNQDSIARSEYNYVYSKQSKIFHTTHGRFERIISFCERQQVQSESTFIILGDVGLNYYGDRRDRRGKDALAQIPITFFCIHGNHEMRPSEELGYQVKEYHGGKVWVQPEYPNLVFAIDGEIYDFFGHSCIVIGGAYSVDKYYRLARGYNWFEDEQPSDEIKEKVERVLSERDWKIDVVLSHTCPLRYEPAEVFLLCNVGDILFHRLRLIVCKPLEDGTEDATLTDTATDISCEKQRFHGEISILCVCTEESICNLLVTLPSECADGRKQIQALRLSGLICNRSIFRMSQIRFVL